MPKASGEKRLDLSHGSLEASFTTKEHMRFLLEAAQDVANEIGAIMSLMSIMKQATILKLRRKAKTFIGVEEILGADA